MSLEGSRAGITYFIKPSFAQLKTISVWHSAANQIFFTLGPGLSVLTTYGSYNIATNNCYYDALISVLANFAASFLAGFVVFSALGHMTVRLGTPIESVVGEGASLSFIAYPEILATFKYPTFFSILFFLMVINLGLDSDFGGLEAMYTALSDEYPLLKRQRKFGMFIMCCLLILGCLPTVTYGKHHMIFDVERDRYHSRRILCRTISGYICHGTCIDGRRHDGSNSCELGKTNIFRTIYPFPF